MSSHVVLLSALGVVIDYEPSHSQKLKVGLTGCTDEKGVVLLAVHSELAYVDIGN